MKNAGLEGEGDKKIQAPIVFRMCLTDHPETEFPFHETLKL